MTVKKFFLFIYLLFLFLSISADAQTKASLQRSTPEAQGVSSKVIVSFVDAVQKSKHEFHSFMLLRHGKVIAEAWWKPYRSDLLHSLYSVSKSFTSTAVGFAVSEKHITLDDKVISFFPHELPDTVSTYLAELRIKDLLTMSVGMDPDPSFIRTTNDTNWVKAFLSTPLKNKPGTKFLYNSLGTYMLSAIVQKVTGQKIIDYLKPRLFDPLGINGADWETSPLGINTGGWGLRVKTEDMAKLGQLYLQKGNWKGRQVLPKEWVEEATTMKIDQNPYAAQSKRDSSDWLQGYCYQFWRCRNNAFRADGAYGQYIIVMPEQDAVLAITAETSDMQDEINLVWNYLLPSMQNKKLPADKKSYSELKQLLTSLALPLPAKNNNESMAANLTGKTVLMEPNYWKVESISFNFKGDLCKVNLKIANVSYDLSYGAGSWQYGETAKLGPSLVLNVKGHFAGLPPSKVAGCFSWKDSNTIELTLRYIDSPHTETMICRFDKNKVTVDIMHSQEKYKKVVLNGELR